MKLQQFSGGLSTRQRPQFLGVNEGAVYTNIDSDVGSLAPIKDKTATAISVSQFHTFYDAQQEWVDANVVTDYLEYQSILYSSDRITRPKRYDGSNTYQLGIDVPDQLTSFTPNKHPEYPNDITIDIDTTLPGLPVVDTYYVIANADGTKLSGALEVLVTKDGVVQVLSTNSDEITAPTLAKIDPGTAERQLTIKEPLGITIGSSGVKVYRLYADKYYLVGLLPTSSSSLIDNVLDISANEELDQTQFGAISGTIQYAFTYYNSADGIESGLSTPSPEITLDRRGTINLNAIFVSSDPQVDKKRIYRIGGNLTSFTRVIELNNSETTFLDTLSDTEVEGTLADTIDDEPAPAGLAFLTEAYAMIFAAEGKLLRFTPIGKPANWPALYFLTFDALITGIAAVANGILVFTKTKTHLVTGTGPTVLASQSLSLDQGCLDFSSIRNVSGDAIWVSSDGICASAGDAVRVLSQDKLGKLTIDAVDSTIFNEVYYVQDSSGLVTAFDYGTGKIFKQFNFGTVTLAVANDELYGWSGNTLYKLLSAETYTTLEYLSPRFIEGRVTELKTYKKVYIYSKGDIILKILIDDEIIRTIELTVEGVETIQVPEDKQRGSFIQFEVSGTGEVYEIEYEAGPRQNG